MNKKVIFLSLVLALALTAPGWADSKSVSVRVSCSVKPMIQMNAPSFRHIKAETNLEKKYQMTEDIRQTSNGKVKLYSLTAL